MVRTRFPAATATTPSTATASPILSRIRATSPQRCWPMSVRARCSSPGRPATTASSMPSARMSATSSGSTPRPARSRSFSTFRPASSQAAASAACSASPFIRTMPRTAASSSSSPTRRATSRCANIVRSAGDPALANPAPVRTIITIPHPTFGNHNGGSLAFGPDGYLYVATGDGGGGNDPGDNAQNTAVLLGKILRLDVDGDDFPADASRNYAIPADNPFAGATAGADEIWDYGLRNPWRFSFDSATGDLLYRRRRPECARGSGFRGGRRPGRIPIMAGTTARAPCRARAPRRSRRSPSSSRSSTIPAGRQLDHRRLRLSRPRRRPAGRLFLRRFRQRARLSRCAW